MIHSEAGDNSITNKGLSFEVEVGEVFLREFWQQVFANSSHGKIGTNAPESISMCYPVLSRRKDVTSSRHIESA